MDCSAKEFSDPRASTYEHSVGQKNVQESNWQFDSRPRKVENRLVFLACKWHATYHWKVVDEGYNFASNLISNQRFARKVMGLQSCENPNLAISGLPLGSSGTNCHLDVGPVERHRVYYKGEGGGFPQVLIVVSLMSLNLLVAHPSTKSAQTIH